jgi:hypothetical protein
VIECRVDLVDALDRLLALSFFPPSSDKSLLISFFVRSAIPESDPAFHGRAARGGRARTQGTGESNHGDMSTHLLNELCRHFAGLQRC